MDTDTPARTPEERAAYWRTRLAAALGAAVIAAGAGYTAGKLTDPPGAETAAAAIRQDFARENIRRVSCPDVVRPVIPCTVILSSGNPMAVWYDTRTGGRGYGRGDGTPYIFPRPG